MKPRFLSFLLVAGLLCGAAPLQAQPVVNARQIPLALSFDLDGEAADDDQVVASVQLADAGSYTVAANPDVCRLVDITVTDADSSITTGTLTIVGTDCWGAPLTATFTFAAGGSGVKTLTVTSGRASAAYFKTITTVSNGALTGEAAGDLLKVGYTGNSAQGWAMYGRYDTSPTGARSVDVFGSYTVTIPVKNGSAQTDITTVTASAGPFQNVLVGDLLCFNVTGEQTCRKITTRTDANNVIVNAAIPLPTAGIGFVYKKAFYSTDPQDGWFPVFGFDTVSTVVQVDANVATGGVVSSIECASILTEGPASGVPDVIFEEDTATVNSGATGTDTTSLDLRLKPNYTHCRVGVKFGTGDDGDGANENIDLVVGFRR